MESIHLLDMTTVGLGNLTEYQLLVLLGNYHSLALVENKDFMPNGIVDSSNRLLYPAYYMTHLKVPLNNFVENFTLWEKTKVCVDVKKFGANILDSYYTFDRYEKDNLNCDPITMSSNSMFVLDATIDKSVNHTSAIPQVNKLTNLEKLRKIPSSLQKFKSIRTNGFKISEGELIGNYSSIYHLVENRDVSNNHGVMFAKFTEIMNICELEYLCGAQNIGLPKEISSVLHTVERETYYYNNCFADDIIECKMELRMEKCDEKHLTGKKNEITPYWLYETFELYNELTRRILVISKARKLICCPITAMDLEDDINRIILNIK